MISQLTIENLILVKQMAVQFGPGLNILTGETGSGKSVILTALRLAAGERADLDTIGKWKDQTIIEAQVGDHQIRREIHRSGKSQCWIDQKPVTLSFFKQFIGNSIEIVDQNSSHNLGSTEQQRIKFDLFAGLALENSQFANGYYEQMNLKSRLDDLQRRKSDYERDLSWAETSLSLIQEVNWKQEEEKSLNEEHERLSHLQELTENLSQIALQLQENSSFKQLAHQLQGCVRFDGALQQMASMLKNAALEVDDAEKQIRSYLDRLEADPSRFTFLESRLAAIDSLKKRFGPTHADVEKKRLHFQNLIDSQSEVGDEINSLSSQLAEVEEKNRLLAKRLSEKRKNAAPRFAQAALTELKALNLPHAKFEVRLEEKPISASGCESVRFFFSANQGHELAPLEDCASGGEQSRLLFAIQSILAEKQQTGCLILDEIDSNIGGYTASIVGEKLKQLASHRQVICVTHFPQVARHAIDHFSVSKKAASIEISHLSPEQREKEYLRMQGILN